MTNLRRSSALCNSFALLVAVLLSSSVASAQPPQPADLSADGSNTFIIQREVERSEFEKTFIPTLEPRRYQAIDLKTLEALAISAPSHIYEILPRPTFRPLSPRNVNLYLNDSVLSSPFRLDMRLSTNISFEARSNYFDALLILRPLQRQVSIGIGHRFSDNTSFYSFFNPLTQEVMGLFTHRFATNGEWSLLAYRDPRIDRTDFIGSLKFRF